MSNPEYLAKGTHVLAAQAVIDARLGSGTFLKLAQTAGASWPAILPMQWYDLNLLLKILVEAANRLGRSVELLTTEIATQNAKNDLTTVYRVFLRILRPTIVLGFMPRMWETYFKFGTVKVVTNERGQFTLITSAIPERYLSWLRGGWMGFLPEKIRVAGGVAPLVTVDKIEPDELPGTFRMTLRATYQ